MNRTDSTAASLHGTVLAALFAALTAVGSFLSIPLPFSPVPIVLQNLFIMLAGLLLGPKWGAASVGIYLLLGAIGLPVFAGGTGGIAHFAGPTGGYLIAYLPAVVLIGWIARRNGNATLFDALALLAGTAVIYAVGIGWLKIALGVSWGRALTIGMLPYLPGDLLKLVASVILASGLRPILLEFLPQGGNRERER